MTSIPKIMMDSVKSADLVSAELTRLSESNLVRGLRRAGGRVPTSPEINWIQPSCQTGLGTLATKQETKPVA